MKKVAVVFWVMLFACAGNRQISVTQNEKSLQKLQQDVAAEPENVALHIQLGEAFFALQNHSAAREVFNQALKIDPTSKTALFGKGASLWHLGQRRAATEVFYAMLDDSASTEFHQAIARLVGCPYKVSRISDGIADNAYPSVSPDGESLLFQSNRTGNWDIFLLELGTGNLQQLTFDRKRDEAPIFSPDGQSFAFTTTRDDSIYKRLEDSIREIYLGRFDGSPVQRLTNNVADDWAPVFGPKGDFILFLSDRDMTDTGRTTSTQIYGFDLTTRTVWRETDSPTKKNLGDVSPLQAQIYFSESVDDEFQVFSKKLGHFRSQQVTTYEGKNVGVKCSADGASLVFFSMRHQNYDIFMMDLRSRQVVQLTAHPSVDANPVFAPDSKAIYFHSNREGRYQIYRIDLTSPSSSREVKAALAELADLDS